MNERIKKLWVAALKSGEFVQGVGCLRKTSKGVVQHCCLGVLEELAVREGVIRRFKGSRGSLQLKVVEWADLPKSNPDLGNGNCVRHNDGSPKTKRLTFKQIANLINRYL